MDIQKINQIGTYIGAGLMLATTCGLPIIIFFWGWQTISDAFWVSVMILVTHIVVLACHPKARPALIGIMLLWPVYFFITSTLCVIINTLRFMQLWRLPGPSLFLIYAVVLCAIVWILFAPTRTFIQQVITGNTWLDKLFILVAAAITVGIFGDKSRQSDFFDDLRAQNTKEDEGRFNTHSY